MFFVNLDCFDIQKFETNVGQAYFIKFYFHFFYLSVLLSHCRKVFSLFLRMNISLVWLQGHILWCVTPFWIHWYFRIKDSLRFEDFIIFFFGYFIPVTELASAKVWHKISQQHSMQTGLIQLSLIMFYLIVIV